MTKTRSAIQICFRHNFHEKLSPGYKNGLERRPSRFSTICAKNQVLKLNIDKVTVILRRKSPSAPVGLCAHFINPQGPFSTGSGASRVTRSVRLMRHGHGGSAICGFLRFAELYRINNKNVGFCITRIRWNLQSRLQKSG